MQFEQVISWIKGHPILTGAIGAYLLIGIIVLWAICRSYEKPSATGFVRGILTGIFALPIWPIVWLVWVLQFRRFAPGTVDLSDCKLPIIDLSSFRADDIRFTPQSKNAVVEAEIVHDPSVPGASKRPPIKSVGPPPKGVRPDSKPKPKVKTKRVSVAAKKPTKPDKPASVPDSAKQAAKKLEPTPPPAAKRPVVSPSAIQKPAASPSPKDASKSAVSAKAPPPPPAAKSPAAKSPAKKSGLTPSAPPKKPEEKKPESKKSAQVAPNWSSVPVENRKPEPPSAPPMVQKVAPAKDSKTAESNAPAPFPKPVSPPAKPLKPSSEKQVASPDTKPDVPEIPIK